MVLRSYIYKIQGTQTPDNNFINGEVYHLVPTPEFDKELRITVQLAAWETVSSSLFHPDYAGQYKKLMIVWNDAMRHAIDYTLKPISISQGVRFMPTEVRYWEEEYENLVCYYKKNPDLQNNEEMHRLSNEYHSVEKLRNPLMNAIVGWKNKVQRQTTDEEKREELIYNLMHPFMKCGTPMMKRSRIAEEGRENGWSEEEISIRQEEACNRQHFNFEKLDLMDEEMLAFVLASDVILDSTTARKEVEKLPHVVEKIQELKKKYKIKDELQEGCNG